MAINTATGVREADPLLVRAAVAFGARRWSVIRKVILPSALPMIFAGLRLGAGTALLLLVATVLEVPAFLAATISGPSRPGTNPDFAIPGMTSPRWVLTVLYALGVSMMASAVFIRARSAIWALLAGAAILATALTTPGPEHFETEYGFLRTVLMLSRWSHGVWAQYPFVPWFGITALGVLLGRWLR